MTKSVKPTKTASRLTPKQWAEAEALWESGEVTLDDLASKFGKSRATMQRHFRQHGIHRGANAEANKAIIKKAVQDTAIDDATILANRIRETKEDHYKMATAIAKLTWSEIMTAKKEEKPLSQIKDNLKSLESAMKILAAARAERYALLGLNADIEDDDEGLPELVISELTAEQIEEMRKKDEDDLADMVIPSEIEGLEDEPSMPDGDEGEELEHGE